ncbi:GNAT family N-acetyltransferase [Sphingomonas sp. Y38-1Y]|uniref:GNAT family N-acetyltransferase n=1 Tax=Sphingomonas sp. Y38-1Y TaxID=3078265 RepID=UPI0028E47213|nr:GNAT family N-acetyltransferase [Sphingomonas sp. Y38-1Y]
MTTGPVLQTDRLILRLPEPQDFDAWAAMAAAPETMRFLGGAMAQEVAWRDFAMRRGAWDVRGFSMFSVIERDGGAWVGRIGPWQPEGWPGTEIGWGVHPAFAGRGYAHEAAVACMDFAVDRLGWTDIIHTIDPANTRSIALAERLGSRNRGPTRLPPPLADFPVHAWGQTAAEWKARRRG